VHHVDHLQGDAQGRDRRLPARVQNTQHLDHAVAGVRRDGTGAGEGRVRRTLGIEVVVLAPPTTIVSVRGGHLQYLDPGLLQKAEQAGAIAAGRLDTDASQRAERVHPSQHLPIALAGRGKAGARQNPIPVIDGRGDVQILMAVDTPTTCRS
jgi:hypothetical protein